MLISILVNGKTPNNITFIKNKNAAKLICY